MLLSFYERPLRAPKSRIVDHAYCWLSRELQLGKRPEKPIPDYALDKHARRGKWMRHGIQHFFDFGAQLDRKALPDPYEDRTRQAMLRAERAGK